MRRDVIIIGGGPAGAAAAITLARAGHRAMVLERNTGPTDKVCGDFLSAETVAHASALGVDPASLGAAPISRVRLIKGRREAEATLPFPAQSLSRRRLDAALLARTDSAGATVLTGQTVRRLTRENEQWIVQADRPMTAGTIFLATGKHDLRDQPRPSAISRSVGLKMYFSLSTVATDALAGATELTLFPGGYAGLQPVEDGHAALCIAVTQAALRETPAWDALLGKIAAGCPRFGKLLQGARPLLPKPLAVAGVPYGFLHRTDPAGVFRLGDQVAVIPSLTGDGMAIALHSGQRAAETWLAGGDAGAYQTALVGTLAPQMRLASLLHRACTSNLLQTAAVAAASLYPPLLRMAAIRTRLRAPLAVNAEPGRQSPRSGAVAAKQDFNADDGRFEPISQIRKQYTRIP